MKDKTQIVHTRIIEWYDGIIKGLIKKKDSWYFCSTIAWKIEERLRVFCLFSISDKLRNVIEAIINEGKDLQKVENDLEGLLARVYEDAGEAISIVLTSNIDEYWISERVIDKKYLTKVYNLSVEDLAFQSQKERDFWFNKFE